MLVSRLAESVSAGLRVGSGCGSSCLSPLAASLLYKRDCPSVHLTVPNTRGTVTFVDLLASYTEMLDEQEQRLKTQYESELKVEQDMHRKSLDRIRQENEKGTGGVYAHPSQS